MKRDKKVQSTVNFSDQFIPVEDTEALITEKLSKRAAKRARKKKKQDEGLNSIPEQEWRMVSLLNPPPIPTEKEEDNLVATSSNNNKKRKRKNAVQGDSSNKNNEVVDLNSLEWSEVNYPDSIFMGDEIGGFLCLEEIDDIDVEYVDNKETQGKTIKFKVRLI